MIIEITAIILIAFLTTKELAGAVDSQRAQRIARFFIVPIIPLAIWFILMVMLRVIEMAL